MISATSPIMYTLPVNSVLLASICTIATPLGIPLPSDPGSDNQDDNPICWRDTPGVNYPDPYQACAEPLAAIGDGDPNEIFDYAQHPVSYHWQDASDGCGFLWVYGKDQGQNVKATRGTVYQAALALKEHCFLGWDSDEPVFYGTFAITPPTGKPEWGNSELAYWLYEVQGTNKTDPAAVRVN